MTGLRRYANQRDKTEPEIFETLMKLGCLVERTNKPFDAVISYRGRVYLVECKTPKSKTGRVNMTADQQSMIDDGWPVAILKSADDAIQFIQSISKRAA
jgi:hypothetical protein